MARSDRLLISVEDDQDLLHSPLHLKRVKVEKGLEIEDEDQIDVILKR